ncbi:MAG: DUF975 family protein [Treponema sp.]
MFDRIKYKKFAILQLKGRWTVPVLVTLLYEGVMILLNLPQYKNVFIALGNPESFAATYDALSAIHTPIRARGISTLTSTAQMFGVFVLVAAQIHLYIKMSRSADPVYFSDFIEGLSLWWRGIRAGLLVGVKTILWMLLFFIPGIIKAYAYSQTYFLIVEYPNLSIRKAIRVSQEITKGHKLDIFVAQMSFIGWWILALLTAGIGFLWLVPYYYMTMTNVFHALLKEAVTVGTITAEDLAG